MNTNFQTIHQMGSAISDFVKQATGRENVQNIEMDHVTVAQNHVYADVDVSGRVVQFSAGEAGLTFEKLLVQIEPVQDLHGYDHPWPAGGGKNLLDADGYSFTTETGTDKTIITNKFVYLEAGETHTFSCRQTGNAGTAIRNLLGVANDTSMSALTWEASNTSTAHVHMVTFTPTVSGNYRPIYWAHTLETAVTLDEFQCEKGSAFTSYAPYSNICPITGWTMVNVYQAGQSLEDVRTFRFTFPSEAGVVYGGTLDVVSGELVVDKAKRTFDGTETWNDYPSYEGFFIYIDSLKKGTRQDGYSNMLQKNSTTTVGQKNTMWLGVDSKYIFAIGVYESMGSTLSDFRSYLSEHNLEVVYPLAEPITYHLTPQEITTLLGQNNIWADTGDIEVKFTNLKELY